jgi:hypothetical protein
VYVRASSCFLKHAILSRIYRSINLNICSFTLLTPWFAVNSLKKFEVCHVVTTAPYAYNYVSLDMHVLVILCLIVLIFLFVYRALYIFRILNIVFVTFNLDRYHLIYC